MSIELNKKDHDLGVKLRMNQWRLAQLARTLIGNVKVPIDEMKGLVSEYDTLIRLKDGLLDDQIKEGKEKLADIERSVHGAKGVGA